MHYLTAKLWEIIDAHVGNYALITKWHLSLIEFCLSATPISPFFEWNRPECLLTNLSKNYKSS